MDKNLQEALKWVYASLGGDITTLAAVNNITEILNAIAALDTVQKINSGGGGSELPAVTTDDNGDVLTVVEGAWAKAAPGGGSGLVISITDDEVAQAFIMDKTFQEIWDAFSAGQAVVIEFASPPELAMFYSIISVSMENRVIECQGEMVFFADTVNDYPVSSYA